MMKFTAIIWKEWMIFRRKFFSSSIGMIVGPLLYLIAFGWGLGDSVEMNGMSYIAFVIPGLVAMNSMTNSYSPIANDINISRIYGQTFESTMTAPINMSIYTIARITAGVLRGMYGAVLILALSFLFQSDLAIDGYFVLILLLNCFVFSSIGFIVGIVINSHADMAKVSNFVITPMSFLCGTFFPLDRFPAVIRPIVNLLPLSITVRGLREGVQAEAALLRVLVMMVYLAVLMALAVRLCKKAE